MSKSNGKRQKAVEALLVCSTIRDAAKQSGCNERTLHRWLNDPEFQSEIEELRRKRTNLTLRQLCMHSNRAVSTLLDLLDAESESVRRAAAKDILEFSLKVSELMGIEERLSALEAQIEAS